MFSKQSFVVFVVIVVDKLYACFFGSATITVSEVVRTLRLVIFLAIVFFHCNTTGSFLSATTKTRDWLGQSVKQRANQSGRADSSIDKRKNIGVLGMGRSNSPPRPGTKRTRPLS